MNAVKLAAHFVARLPRDALSPETTEEREGFVHPAGDRRRRPALHGSTLILRDHDDDKLAEHETARPPARRARPSAAEPRAELAIDA